MTAAGNKPNLTRIGQSAFAEVLGVLLSLSATAENSSCHSPLSKAFDGITSTVLLAGSQISGSVHIQLPLAFVARAVQQLTGLDDAAGDAREVQDDAAGEFANMVAGRVAAQLAAHGYPCKLGIPSVSRSPSLPIGTEPGMDHGRTDLFCDGHWLSLELKCRYAVP